MLAVAGHGTAMPTAPAEVRAVARYVAPPLEDEGAGRMIEALALATPERGARARPERMAAEATERQAAAATARGPRGMTARVVVDDQAGRDGRRSRSCASGGIVALPTDTVYGIGVALETPGGIERLFAAKRRPPDKGIMLLLDAAGPGGRDRGR